MATEQQVAHYVEMAAQVAAREPLDEGIYCQEWRINASRSADEVWFHVTAGAMHGGVFMSPMAARKLAARLLDAAEGGGMTIVMSESRADFTDTYPSAPAPLYAAHAASEIPDLEREVAATGAPCGRWTSSAPSSSASWRWPRCCWPCTSSLGRCHELQTGHSHARQ